MNMTKETRKNKGISLIVLVITIIIMIILSASIILSLNGSNIINKASEAKVKNDWAALKEKKSMMETEVLQNKAVDPVVIGDFELSYNDETEEVDIKYIETVGGTTNKALIPEGFSYVEGTISTGMVITDSAGNEFVWVLVDGYALSGTPDANGLYNEFKNIFQRKEYNMGVSISSCTEPCASGYANENKEYYDMMKSVQNNGGFYIGRYEAGKEGTNTLVVKKGATVWNNIPWGDSMTNIGTSGAVYYSQQMYKGSNTVVSHLTYGVEWDAALQFIERNSANTGYATDSTGKGYYAYDSDMNQINPEEVQKAGSNDAYKVNNIYDMAGNVMEWTMEAYSTNNRVYRGGGCDDVGSYGPASIRSFDIPHYAHDYIGFRPSLYIK